MSDQDAPREPDVAEAAEPSATPATPGAPAPPTPPRPTMIREWRDAVTPRAVGLVIGVLVLQLGFILSYAGAFHSPTPHRIPVGVVAPQGAPAAQVQQAVKQINALPGQPLRARIVADRAQAVKLIKSRDLSGAVLVGATGSDQLLVASAEGGALSSALEQVVRQVETSEHRTLAGVTDLVPAGKSDARGLTGFYLAVGWVVGGYLVASILAISAGARPSTQRRAQVRLGALALYSVVSGIGGAVIVGPALGAYDLNSGPAFWGLSFFGALLVFAVGAFTMAIQALTGVVGIGIAVLLFVVLGNPSAGGAYPAPLLPSFWRAIGPLLPPGAGTSGVRGIVYFDGAKLTEPLVVCVAYAVVGVAVLLLSGLRQSMAPAAQRIVPSPA